MWTRVGQERAEAGMAGKPETPDAFKTWAGLQIVEYLMKIEEKGAQTVKDNAIGKLGFKARATKRANQIKYYKRKIDYFVRHLVDDEFVAAMVSYNINQNVATRIALDISACWPLEGDDAGDVSEE